MITAFRVRGREADAQTSCLARLKPTVWTRPRQVVQGGGWTGCRLHMVGDSRRVPQAGIEPATNRLEGGCSIR